MSTPAIKITIKLFAAYQDVIGLPELTLELPPGSTVGQVGEYVWTQYPVLASLKSVTHFGVNLNFVPADTLLQTGDEVVLIPPVSGG
ncbi:MAG: MoaD/ThiS family protein [Acaryochloris sp. RU_4_1]|nr:MoaD/ThiS family protein [Acaryochloris sp. SU_5_25]NJM66857.1 MoaD/ThiS family protein [Acaryochloris sp. RU_4_1]NJR55747.1 MoaD/ThiS family protein [Acaryochloris sp. CRU_2_0]